MDFFDILTLFGGLAFFLFGMNLMGSGLEKSAGGRLKLILRNMTSTPARGFLLGAAVTAVVQSSSATTVMLVGFVNSGLMTLEQTVGVTLGANMGAVATFWLLSLSGVRGSSFIVSLFKPSTFTPILAFVGILLYMFQKDARRKDIGTILLGFAVLMFGMEVMSGAVAGLKEVPRFTQILTLFSNPVLGVVAGTVITAVIQSSSASVGILQALTVTGAVTYANVIPIAMGQNIGTCISALIACVGTSKDARRTAMVHLLFNVISMVILLPVYCLLNAVFQFDFIGNLATPVGIALVHTVYKLLSIAILFPLSRFLVRLSCFLIRDSDQDKKPMLLDERLMASPSVAVAHCREVVASMAEDAAESLRLALTQLFDYDKVQSARVRELEDQVDVYEDQLGTYLVRLSSHPLVEKDNMQANQLLHMISDFERISDHAVNIVESAEEIREKRLSFSGDAQQELDVMFRAVEEIVTLSITAFREADLAKAAMVEPLEQVVDDLKDTLRRRHIDRLQRQECTIELGFVLTDLLTNLERISDHCSNIAGCMLEMEREDMVDIHAYLRHVKQEDGSQFSNYFDYFRSKYDLSEPHARV